MIRHTLYHIIVWKRFIHTVTLSFDLVASVVFCTLRRVYAQSLLRYCLDKVFALRVIDFVAINCYLVTLRRIGNILHSSAFYNIHVFLMSVGIDVVDEVSSEPATVHKLVYNDPKFTMMINLFMELRKTGLIIDQLLLKIVFSLNDIVALNFHLNV